MNYEELKKTLEGRLERAQAFAKAWDDACIKPNADGKLPKRVTKANSIGFAIVPTYSNLPQMRVSIVTNARGYDHDDISLAAPVQNEQGTRARGSDKYGSPFFNITGAEAMSAIMNHRSMWVSYVNDCKRDIDALAKNYEEMKACLARLKELAKDCGAASLIKVSGVYLD